MYAGRNIYENLPGCAFHYYEKNAEKTFDVARKIQLTESALDTLQQQGGSRGTTPQERRIQILAKRSPLQVGIAALKALGSNPVLGRLKKLRKAA
mgnify:CR=1 FL=1